MKRLYLIRNTSDSERWERVQQLKALVEKQLPHHDVRVVEASIQKAWVEEVLPIAINLDPFSRGQGHFPLDVCRVFEGEKQGKAQRIQERPGTPPLNTQLERLPAGHYTLMDDDICTGGTVSCVKTLIAERRPDVVITDVWSLIHKWGDAHGLPMDHLDDVIDSHDFIPGASTSGLVVERDGVLQRILYSDPCINLIQRATFTDPERFRQEWSSGVLRQQV
jgi:hypothetical protein